MSRSAACVVGKYPHLHARGRGMKVPVGLFRGRRIPGDRRSYAVASTPTRGEWGDMRLHTLLGLFTGARGHRAHPSGPWPIMRPPMSAPTVTVVIPCFNHGRFIEDAVRSCLAQTGADVRVIVVDDGSDDGTTPGACDACAEKGEGRVAVVHQPNMGLPATRNRGAREASERGGAWAGEYLV